MGGVVVMQQLYAAASRIDDSDLNTPKTPTHHTFYYPTTLLPLLRLGSVGWILLLFLLPLPCAFRMVVAPAENCLQPSVATVNTLLNVLGTERFLSTNFPTDKTKEHKRALSLSLSRGCNVSVYLCAIVSKVVHSISSRRK